MVDNQSILNVIQVPNPVDLINANDPAIREESKRKIDLQNSYPPLTFFAAGSNPFDVSHRCPICGVGQPANARYKQYICGNCVDRATDEAGDKLKFYNAGMFGGLLVKIASTNETIETEECLIDRVRCSVEEGRFGGIVVQPK